MDHFIEHFRLNINTSPPVARQTHYRTTTSRPPTEHNSIGHPTTRDHRRDKRAVVENMVHHHSFQEDDTTPALCPNQKADCEGRSRSSSEPRVKPRHRSRKKDLGTDANDHHDAEVQRRLWLRYSNNEDLGADATNHHEAELWRRPWLRPELRYLNEDLRVNANSHRDADLPRHFASGDDNGMTDWSAGLATGVLPELLLARLRDEQRRLIDYTSPQS